MFLRLLLSLIAGIASGYFFYDIIYSRSILLANLVGLLIYYIVWRTVKSIQNRSKKPETKGDPFRSIQVEKAVKEGSERLRNIRSQTRLIADNEIAVKIQDICKTGLDIFDYIQKNPDDLTKAKQFINYYLDTTEKIVNKYVDLISKKERNSEIDAAISNVENVLDSIKDTYTKQLHNLLEDDLLDLNTEIKVLEKTIKLEG
ncbi:MAG TPA: 5-bromo-4-chloroindolyl phosphate hydrolysis family protein [Spirochaetota bacterium]|nr:5-bromo-4-chloroindolyl phosphate hydrolysis family protein [Spirochaetota bacterium]HPF06586.1 5-bromo-4-chloroindolyl phosphate hydrolysis family protein [Spirochaetota bacterium]HPJ43290.1 5-bromo-4-chloroindolyl phosphate hydrolysis family protein [Spirochaetota bacterium]HPR38185.1 5-bromo-4-chloroindolyl phosphate hydrolysis family protein [Spirochaetota bacterium]HRX48657.1 5-bromo-4-chloroindolyl phosphate hydrolysis family protein [Spirochaetota bacterium]